MASPLPAESSHWPQMHIFLKDSENMWRQHNVKKKKKLPFQRPWNFSFTKLTCLTSSQTDTLVTHSHTCTPHTCTPHTCTPHACTPHTVLRCQLARAQRTLLTCCQWDSHAALQFALLTMDWEPQSSIWLTSSPSHHAPGSRRDIFNSSKERQ